MKTVSSGTLQNWRVKAFGSFDEEMRGFFSAAEFTYCLRPLSAYARCRFHDLNQIAPASQRRSPRRCLQSRTRRYLARPRSPCASCLQARGGRREEEA